MSRSRLSFRSVVISTVVAALLQLGAVSGAMPVQPVPAAGGSQVAHDSACASDTCPDGMCAPEQCHLGVTPSCNCSCMQAATESVSELYFPPLTATAVRLADAIGSALGRLDRPFRPPA